MLCNYTPLPPEDLFLLFSRKTVQLGPWVMSLRPRTASSGGQVLLEQRIWRRKNPPSFINDGLITIFRPRVKQWNQSVNIYDFFYFYNLKILRHLWKIKFMSIMVTLSPRFCRHTILWNLDLFSALHITHVSYAIRGYIKLFCRGVYVWGSLLLSNVSNI